MPWQDVIIDVQGPYTVGENGEQYLLSYHCTRLKVPKLAAFRELKPGPFLRALTTCVFKSRVIPDTVRSDRGQEMTNLILTEFYALCNCRRILGASYAPRHQGLNERGHQETMTNHLILIHAICKAFPQEWPALVEALEYLYETEPQGAGLSANDLLTGYSLVSEVDRRLAPFVVPRGAAETSDAARLFTRFTELFGIFDRHAKSRSKQLQEVANRRRALRTFDPGEVVFWRKPAFGRPAKQLLSPPSVGPCKVVSQPTQQSLILEDANTGKPINGGANIPLD